MTSVGSGSDTYGLYEERMTISRRINNELGFKEETLLEVDGWSITANNISEN